MVPDAGPLPELEGPVDGGAEGTIATGDSPVDATAGADGVDDEAGGRSWPWGGIVLTVYSSLEFSVGDESATYCPDGVPPDAISGGSAGGRPGSVVFLPLAVAGLAGGEVVPEPDADPLEVGRLPVARREPCGRFGALRREVRDGVRRAHQR